MKIKFPQLIYFIDYTNKHLLLRFRLLPLNQSLLLETSVYQLTIQDSNANLRDSFYNNPTDEGLFDKTNKKLINSSHVGFNELIEFKRYLENKSEQDNEIHLNFLNKTVTVHLEQFQKYGLTIFINDLCNNYTNYQISLIEIITKYKDQIEEEVVKVEPVKLKDVIIEIPPLEIDNKIENNNYLSDLLQLSPNNLTTFYLSKYINNDIKLKDKYTIVIPKIITFSYQNRIDLYHIIKSITYSSNEINSRLKTLYNTLLQIIKDQDNFDINKQNVFLILFLIYIYSLKNLPRAEIKVYDYDIDLKDTFVNYLNPIIKGLTPTDSDILIKIEEDKNIPSDSINYKEILDPLIAKYNYLLSIDKDLFIANILREVNIDRSNGKSKAETPPLLTSHSILDLEFLQSLNPPLTNKIEPPDFNIIEYKQYYKPIITYHYYIINEIQTYNKIIDNNKIHPIISKYFQIITNNIFSNIVKNQESIINIDIISTQILMHNYIIPNIEGTYNQLFILYQVVIPYIYDRYKVSKYIDYFI